jgi:hypothetical protein
MVIFWYIDLNYEIEMKINEKGLCRAFSIWCTTKRSLSCVCSQAHGKENSLSCAPVPMHGKGQNGPPYRGPLANSTGRRMRFDDQQSTRSP